MGRHLPYGITQDRGYYYGLIGSRRRAFDWHQNQRPRMTLNGRNVTVAEMNKTSGA